MNPNLTEIVFILDQSGSMDHLAADTIGGYNTFLDEQKSQEGEANITTILFDSKVVTLHDHVPIQDVDHITSAEYRPCGMTALYDAVGSAIDSVGDRLDAAKEEDRPSKVIFVITTDGEENSSWKYDGAHVKEMIEHQKSKYSWEFLFIGAGIDAYRASAAIGIDSHHTASYAATLDGMNNVYCSASKGVFGLRGGGGGGGLAADWKNTDAEITSATTATSGSM